MKTPLLTLLLTVSLLLTPGARAQLAIDRIIVDFSAEQAPQNDVRLSNTSHTETLFINIEVLEVSAPGTDHEQRVVVKDPSQIGLIATPNRLILPPDGQRLVRLVNLFPAGTSERVYRINFTPVAGKMKTDKSAVKLMIGYQALVIVRPVKTVFDLHRKYDGNKLTLTNKGNTNIYLDTIQFCHDKAHKQCQQLTENRLYPGNSWQLEFKEDDSLSFNAFDGNQTRKLSF